MKSYLNKIAPFFICTILLFNITWVKADEALSVEISDAIQASEVIKLPEDFELEGILTSYDIIDEQAGYLPDIAQEYTLQQEVDSDIKSNAAVVSINAKNFPDKKFRNYIKTEFDNGDSTLTKSEIDGVTDIYVDDMGITNLKGIEIFTNLESLSCVNNKLTELNVSKFPSLEGLYCSENMLSKLDVSKNRKLEYLYCTGNKISSLNLRNCPELGSLDCSDNKISKLDITANTKLGTLECNNNRLSSLDISKCKALQGLYCSDNNISKLNVSNNTKLEYLYCSGNKISSLNVLKCTKLNTLDCSDNSISSFDVARLPNHLYKMAIKARWENDDSSVHCSNDKYYIAFPADTTLYNGSDIIYSPTRDDNH